MTFRDSLDNLKLDLTNLVLIPSGGTAGMDCDFDIKPKDFLRYAREDMHTNENRGTINGLSNAKRAIDCQIDEVFHCLGIDFQNLPKSIEPLVNYFDFKDNISYKLKIIQGLNLAPGLIIAKSRNLRNKLEHFYNIPTIAEVKEAIDVADLFIRYIEGKLKFPMNEFYITDENNLVKESLDSGLDFKSGYMINFDFEKKELYMQEVFDQQGKIKGGNVIDITNNNTEFYGFIRLMNSIDDVFEINESFKLILQLINHPIPAIQINARQY